MSKVSILDIATLNQSDSFLTELSETELQISGGCHGYAHGHNNCYGGSSKKGSKNKGSKNKGSKNKGSKNKGRHGHSCW